MEITLGTWIFPLLITVACFFKLASVDNSGRFPDFSAVIVNGFLLMISMFSWLVWALMKVFFTG